MTVVSLLPAQVNWTIYEGATFKKIVTVLTSGVGSTPVNLTNYTGEMTIRNQPTQDVLMVLTSSNGGLIFGGTLGTIEVYIPNTVTSLLGWRTAVFDLLVTEPTGDVDALLRGNLTVTGNIY